MAGRVDKGSLRISIVIPTFGRDEVLVDTVRSLRVQLLDGDEIVVVDQTYRHDPKVAQALFDLGKDPRIRWIRKWRPSICEAMNVGVLVAENPLILFLDDDVNPAPDLLSSHRRLYEGGVGPLAVNGQILQPWEAAPVATVRDFGLGFSNAYDKPCEILGCMTGNLSIRREVFLAIGGMDENFFENAYRCDAELGYRLYERTGRKAQFDPRPTLRHLFAAGGNRLYGSREAWRHFGGAVGDYYFAMRALPQGERRRYIARRLARSPFSRRSVIRPWVAGLILVRDILALGHARRLVKRSTGSHVQKLDAYADVDRPRPAEENGLLTLGIIVARRNSGGKAEEALSEIGRTLGPEDEVLLPLENCGAGAVQALVESRARVRSVAVAMGTLSAWQNAAGLVARSTCLLFSNGDPLTVGDVEAVRRGLGEGGATVAVVRRSQAQRDEAGGSVAAVGIRRDLFIAIGGFDEGFAGGGTEAAADLLHRLERAGEAPLVLERPERPDSPADASAAEQAGPGSERRDACYQALRSSGLRAALRAAFSRHHGTVRAQGRGRRIPQSCAVTDFLKALWLHLLPPRKIRSLGSYQAAEQADGQEAG